MSFLNTVKAYLFGTTRGLIFITWMAVVLLQLAAGVFATFGGLGWILHLALVLAVYFPLWSTAKKLDDNAGRPLESLKDNDE